MKIKSMDCTATLNIELLITHDTTNLTVNSVVFIIIITGPEYLLIVGNLCQVGCPWKGLKWLVDLIPSMFYGVLFIK